METLEEKDARVDRELHRWHVRQFLSLGFELRDSQLLDLAHVDWREADELLGRGCPHETAMLILI